MANSIIGYTNDLTPEKVVYTGIETDTAVVIVDNDPESETYSTIGVNVKPSGVEVQWGNIKGTLNNQTDLKTALDSKANDSSLSVVAKTGKYSDLLNAPLQTINSDDFTVVSGELQLDKAVLSKIDRVPNIETNLAQACTNITALGNEITQLQQTKQNNLIPGQGITISASNVISSTVDIDDLKNRVIAAEADIEALEDVTDSQAVLIAKNAQDIVAVNVSKQDKLTPGANISIFKDSEGRTVISSSGGGEGSVKSVNGYGPDASGNVNVPIPSKTSQLVNDSNFITNAVDNLVNYYKKSETYTQEEVNALIAGIETLKVKVVDVLPAVGEANTLYLLRKQGYCEEYLWIDNKYEKIGETTVDLSEYRKYADQDVIDNAIKDRISVIEGKEAGWDAKSVVSGTDDGTNWSTITINGTTKNIPVGGGATYTAGNGIAIDNNTISTKLGNGLKHTDDGKLTINPADRSISVGEFGVHVPVITTSLDVTDNGLAVKIADDSIIAYNSGTGTKGIKVNTDKIQSKLVAGSNIQIAADGKTISATDTTYSAGENISIVNNVISSTGGSAKLTEAITATQTVGGIAQGTTFAVGTTLESIIKQLLGGEPPVTGVKVYYGIVDALPTTDAEIEALTLDQTKDKASLLESGYTWRTCTTNNQYFILAIPNNVGLACYDIKTGGYSAACEEVAVGNYYVYHVGVKTTDTYRVVYSFEEI